MVEKRLRYSGWHVLAANIIRLPPGVDPSPDRLSRAGGLDRLRAAIALSGTDHACDCAGSVLIFPALGSGLSLWHGPNPFASSGVGASSASTPAPLKRRRAVPDLTLEHPIQRPLCRSGFVGWGIWAKIQQARRPGIGRRRTSTANWPNRPSRAIWPMSFVRSRCDTRSWLRTY
jgi:hypothetical protein